MESITPLLEWARGVGVLMVIIIVLVWFHELGHYLSARMFGMKVDAFAVMMGGVRKTDLTPLVARKIVPSGIPWLVTVGLLVGLFVGFSQKIPSLQSGCLIALAIAMPIWVAARLQVLYHLHLVQTARTMAFAWLGGLIVLFIATKFQNLSLAMTLGVLGTGSTIGLAILYYTPVSRKSEDAPQGFGSLEIDGKEVSVRFRPVWSMIGKSGTEFSLLLLPLGGFAQIRGMQPKDDGSEFLVEGGFYSKPAWQRFIVLFAGPLFSLLLAVIGFTVFFMGQGIASGQTTELSHLSVTKAGYLAGLRPGDKIIAVEGKPVKTMFEAISLIRDDVRVVEGVAIADPIAITFIRGKDSPKTLSITPYLEKDAVVLDENYEPTNSKRTQARLGVVGETVYRQPSVGEAFSRAIQTPFLGARALVAVASDTKLAEENVGSVAGLAGQTKDAAKEGAWPVIGLAAGLSLTLGLMNLLPIVPMDGGQMVIALAEILRRGRRLSTPVQQALQGVGMMLIILLTLTAVTLDVKRGSQKTKTEMIGKEK